MSVCLHVHVHVHAGVCVHICFFYGEREPVLFCHLLYISIHRFSSLLQEDKLGVCLDKEDPNLTLVVLELLTTLVRSPDVANELCGHGDPCVPITCYQCLVDPPTGEGSLDTIFNIRSQV